MRKWSVSAMRTPEGDWAVFVNDKLEERGLSGRQASDYVQKWTPPDEAQAQTNGHKRVREANKRTEGA